MLKRGLTGAPRRAELRRVTSPGAIAAVTAGVAFGDPGAGVPLSISSRVATPLVINWLISRASHFS